jgi:hypothetical protein
MAGEILNVVKVQGASYKVAELIIKQPKVIMAVNGKRDEAP